MADIKIERLMRSIYLTPSMIAISFLSKSLTIVLSSTPLDLALDAKYSSTSASKYTGKFFLALGLKNLPRSALEKSYSSRIVITLVRTAEFRF